MPKGEGQQGKRRGRYNTGARATDEAIAADFSPVGEWTDDDLAFFKALVADSPLKSEVTKRAAARRAVEADRQCRALDAMARSADDDANLTKAQTQFRKALELLRVAERVAEEEDDV